MTQTGLAPRRAALELLELVTGEGQMLSEALALGTLSRLPAEDRARAQRIAVTTLRSLNRADRMLKPFIERNPPRVVRNILRIGVVEICSGEAAHGVVNSCVELAGRDKKSAGMKGLVNAVLRKVAAERPGAWDRLPVPRLPDWLRLPLIEAWGKAAVTAMEASHFAGPSLDLTARTDPAKVAAATGGILLPTGSVRLPAGGQVTALPGFAEGEWWVQDAAAALPVQILAPKPGERVLDLCAAPGGKTMQIAASGASVTALDMSGPRLERLRQNLARTGLAAEIVVGDALTFEPGGWDAILLDAPCSATGTIRRHPDLPHAKDGSDFASLIALQAELLDHALGLLRPGGRLVFCTCSLLPDEGEVQVTEALERHPGLTVEPPRGLTGIEADQITEEGGLRLRPDYWPERGGMDGFYMACMRKPA